MKFYVQYDELGNIGATIITDVQAPDCERQLVFEEIINVSGKRVNLETLSLEDVPEPEE